MSGSSVEVSSQGSTSLVRRLFMLSSLGTTLGSMDNQDVQLEASGRAKSAGCTVTLISASTRGEFERLPPPMRDLPAKMGLGAPREAERRALRPDVLQVRHHAAAHACAAAWCRTCSTSGRRARRSASRGAPRPILAGRSRMGGGKRSNSPLVDALIKVTVHPADFARPEASSCTSWLSIDPRVVPKLLSMNNRRTNDVEPWLDTSTLDPDTVRHHPTLRHQCQSTLDRHSARHSDTSV